MQKIRTTAKEILPEPVVTGIKTVRGRINRAYQQVTWHFSLSGWRNYKALSQYQDIHRGERCFIIGNGPSLNETDLKPLAKEMTFGLNRIYLLFEDIGFSTTYYLATNRLVLEQFGSDIERLSIPKFIRWECKHLMRQTPNLMYIRRLPPSFSQDIRQGAWGGATVTYVALQLAYYMGFQQVILIGVDHSFATQGQPHSEVVSTNEDLNHFSPDYFGKGVRWHLPDLKTSEEAYRLAKQYYEADNRTILDATIGGKLEVFPKIPYTHILTPIMDSHRQAI